MGRFASIDMGTNTFRLLIVEQYNTEPFKEIYSENITVRLGEGFSVERRFRPTAIKRAISAITHFQKVLKNKNIAGVVAVGTSAFRQSSNRESFLEIVKRKTGINVEVLSGEEEARCTLLGVNLIFQREIQKQEIAEEPTLVIDIGGGSTEFIVSKEGEPTTLLSIELGVVPLTERYLKTDPPGAHEILGMQDYIDDKLGVIAHLMPIKCRFIGTAGTITTLAAMEQEMVHYDPEKINHYRLSHDSLEKTMKKLIQMSLAARRELPGLGRGREDILIAGILILLRVMRQFKYDTIYVSDYGLREGILVDRIVKGVL